MENDDFPEAQWFEPEPEARVDDDDEVQRPKGPGRPKPKTAVLESKDDDEDEAGVHTSGAQQLRFLLQITNTGDEPIRFTTGIRYGPHHCMPAPLTFKCSPPPPPPLPLIYITKLSFNHMCSPSQAIACREEPRPVWPLGSRPWAGCKVLL